MYLHVAEVRCDMSLKAVRGIRGPFHVRRDIITICPGAVGHPVGGATETGMKTAAVPPWVIEGDVGCIGFIGTFEMCCGVVFDGIKQSRKFITA